ATQYVLEQRAPLYLADVQSDPRYTPMRDVARQRGTVSLLLLPLLIRDQVVGTLGLNAISRREFTAEEIALAQNVAAATSQALENARLYEAVQQELTERKRAEEAAQKAREAAEAANQAKSEFVSTVSHELKVPMTAIQGYTDLMRSGVVGLVNETQAQFLNIIRANADRMNRLVSDLTDISRIESGRLHLEFSAVALHEVVEEVIQSNGAQFQEKEQTLTLAIPDDLPPVWTDRSRLEQILTNLVSNAHKYTPAGGHITVHAESIFSQSGPRKDVAVIHVAIQDNGIGISPEDQQLLFQKFFRSGDEQARVVSGTGLGLSITKELIELQGGRIWFESVLRQGTTFHFILPTAYQSSDGHAAP
ncbi:MAG: HAMP domain-containing histidine kinase, partial [Chloroflexi bacterium]|nr:HAMP domain-containing histidine kinase [Chloroflexota bacterium]